MANVLTGIRIVCSLCLLFCPFFSVLFYVFYIIGGISDVFDGMVARRLGKDSRLGAQLDTIADTVFAAVATVKTVQVVNIPVWIIVWIVLIAVIKFANFINGFVINKRFASEHTVMNKICGAFLFAIPIYIGIFSQQALAFPIITACALATVAAVQEWHYIRIGKEIN